MSPLRMIRLGEGVPIAAMEPGMNVTADALGGRLAGGPFTARFWLAQVGAVPIGFLPMLPVNHVMIAHGLSRHRH